jgi:hypothetical protein
MTAHWNFCTLFDRNYAGRGLALYRSLERHCPDFDLTVLCLDHETRQALAHLALPRVRLVTVEDLGDAELLEVRKTRPHREFCWSCASPLMWWMLRNLPDGAVATYVDADMAFFSDPQPVLDELGDKDILIHGHNFAPRYESFAAHSGLFNVGLVAARNSPTGLACVRRWRAQCIEICVLDPENGYCGDQKYLDEWPQLYGGKLVISSHPGVAVAPWNIGRFVIDEKEGRVTVDGAPLIFYHYHAMRIALAGWLWAVLPAAGYEYFTSRQLELIYRPYVRMLRHAHRELSPAISLPGAPLLGFLRRLRHQKLVYG